MNTEVTILMCKPPGPTTVRRQPVPRGGKQHPMIWEYLSVQQQGVNQAVMFPKDTSFTLVWACQCMCIVSALCWVPWASCALSGVSTVSQHKIV